MINELVERSIMTTKERILDEALTLFAAKEAANEAIS